MPAAPKPQPAKSRDARKAPPKRLPGSGNGKGKERTAQQLERQERVFELRVIERMTVRQVAAAMKIDQKTVIADERAELQRRADEIAGRREVEQAAHMAMIDNLLQTSRRNASIPGTGALGAQAKALEMRAKLLGLDAPTKVDVGMEKILEAIAPPE
jgi:hypothetical protein